MKGFSGSTQEDIIHSWHVRARAYESLISRWPIFTAMTNRLLECIVGKFDGLALDIAGGTGLLSEQLLNKHPNARVILAEPAADMRALAARRLGDRVEIEDVTSDKLDQLDVAVDAAFCSASFHLMDEKSTLSSVASVLRKGSLFASNLWGHSFDEAIDLNQKVDWMQFVDEALAEFDQPPMRRPKSNAHKIKSAIGLKKICEPCGLHLSDKKIVTTEIDTRFNIEFAAMDANFPQQVRTELRTPVINRALELCRGVDIISSVDLIFEKF